MASPGVKLIVDAEESETSPLLQKKTVNLHVQSSSVTSVINFCKMGLRGWLKEVSIPVYVLVMIFAIASWIDINGLWVELPLLVNELPEGWNLPSYLVVIIQVANIGPIAYTIANRCCPRRVKEWPVVYLIIAVGAVACILLAFFWNHTSYIFGSARSTALISLAALLALVDCTSSVVFLPYMANFKPQYMYAFYIGEGLSGFIPGIVGLMQGVGGNPQCVNSSTVIQNTTTGINTTDWNVVPIYSTPSFSVEVFFFFLFGIMLLSGIAFSFLNFLPSCQKEMIQNHVCLEDSDGPDLYSRSTERPVIYKRPSESENTDSHRTEKNIPQEIESDSKTKVAFVGKDSEVGYPEKDQSLTKFHYIMLLIITAWINALTNGVLPSTQSYSCLPYGDTAYTLAVRLSSIANPLACFIGLFIPTKSKTLVFILTLLGSGLAAYHLVLAGYSPYPPLVHKLSGEFLVVMTSVLMTGFFSFAKVTIASIFRDEGRTALLFCGGATQLGSFFGAIITFVLVNILHLFTSKAPCTF